MAHRPRRPVRSRDDDDDEEIHPRRANNKWLISGALIAGAVTLPVLLCSGVAVLCAGMNPGGDTTQGTAVADSETPTTRRAGRPAPSPPPVETEAERLQREQAEAAAQAEARRKAEEKHDARGLVLLLKTVQGERTEIGVEITGTVVNRRKVKLTYAQITYNIYDASGAQVGSALANINGLEPGGRWNFKAVGFHKRVSATSSPS